MGIAPGQAEYVAAVTPDHGQVVGPGLVGHEQEGRAVGEPVRPRPVRRFLGVDQHGRSPCHGHPPQGPTPRHAGGGCHVGQISQGRDPRLDLVSAPVGYGLDRARLEIHSVDIE